MKYQTQENINGEIEFRSGYEDFDNVKRMLSSRIDETVDIFKDFDIEEPVAEFGAERCQRILAVISKFKLSSGYAYDLSERSMSMADIIGERLFSDSPHKRLIRISDDFLSNHYTNHFGFVFCFATLHHFPDPRPVFAAVHRMLKKDGIFYFNREAVESLIGLHEVVRAIKNKGVVKERRYNIIETQFPLEVWEECFSKFSKCDITLKLPLLSFRLHKLNKLTRLIIKITGARISGLCIK